MKQVCFPRDLHLVSSPILWRDDDSLTKFGARLGLLLSFMVIFKSEESFSKLIVGLLRWEPTIRGETRMAISN